MLRRLLTLGMLTLLLPAIVLAENGPTIHFKSLDHDFGEVHYGESPSVEIVFMNTGNETLQISKLRSSCGCAHAVVGGRKVAPGKAGTIEARVKTRGLKSGPHKKTIFVHCNDLKKPVVRLGLYFNVIRHISLDPPFLAVSLLTPQKTVSFDLKATNNWSNPISLKAASADPNGRSVILQPEEVEVLPGGKADFKLLVPVGKETRSGYCSGTVGIETSDPKERIVRIRYLIRLPKAKASASGTDG